MIADIVAGGAQRVGIGRPAALFARHMALEHALGHQRPAHLGVEFVVEPARQPPHLDALARPRRHQPVRPGRARLLDIFGDDGAARNRRLAVGHQHRDVAGRIEQQELLAPLPEALLDMACLDAVFTENQDARSANAGKACVGTGSACDASASGRESLVRTIERRCVSANYPVFAFFRCPGRRVAPQALAAIPRQRARFS